MNKNKLLKFTFILGGLTLFCLGVILGFVVDVSSQKQPSFVLPKQNCVCPEYPLPLTVDELTVECLNLVDDADTLQRRLGK